MKEIFSPEALTVLDPEYFERVDRELDRINNIELEVTLELEGER